MLHITPAARGGGQIPNRVLFSFVVNNANGHSWSRFRDPAGVKVLGLAGPLVDGGGDRRLLLGPAAQQT